VTSPPLRSKPSGEGYADKSNFVKEEDFDKFLKSMEIRTSSMSEKSGKSAFAVSDTSDREGSSDEDDMDFGFWEKASLR
jgi:hypothetical protein